jgi:hypothetical protein
LTETWWTGRAYRVDHPRATTVLVEEPNDLTDADLENYRSLLEADMLGGASSVVLVLEGTVSVETRERLRRMKWMRGRPVKAGTGVGG